MDVRAGDAGGIDLKARPAQKLDQSLDRISFSAAGGAVKNGSRRKLDSERLVPITMQNDVNYVFVEEPRQFRAPGQLEDPSA